MPAINLAKMRHEYEASGIDADSLADDPITQFETWLAVAVDASLPEPNAMVLSTVDGDGQPWGRYVLLKGVSGAGFDFYTNLESDKSNQVRSGGAAALTFGWIDLRRQVNIAGRVEPVAAAEADSYWAVRPRGSQLGGLASNQSRPVGGRAELEAQYDAAVARFGPEDSVPRPEHWGGWRVVPHTVEFWQGRLNRLHDRLRYTRSDGAWTVTRLQP